MCCQDNNVLKLGAPEVLMEHEQWEQEGLDSPEAAFWFSEIVKDSGTKAR